MEEEEGLPKIGDSRNMLGVRPVDITPDEAGDVRPCGVGMSVNPSLFAMLMVHIPRRWRTLNTKFKSARGDDSVVVFKLGEGDFVRGDVATDLVLNPTSPRHGVVEPETKMPFEQYKKALGSTQSNWILLRNPDEA